MWECRKRVRGSGGQWESRKAGCRTWLKKNGRAELGFVALEVLGKGVKVQEGRMDLE